jgi:hypothetical protein
VGFGLEPRIEMREDIRCVCLLSGLRDKVALPAHGIRSGRTSRVVPPCRACDAGARGGAWPATAFICEGVTAICWGFREAERPSDEATPARAARALDGHREAEVWECGPEWRKSETAALTMVFPPLLRSRCLRV